MLADRDAVQQGEAGHQGRVIEGETQGDIAAAVMAREGEPVVPEEGGEVVSAGRIRYLAGTQFVTLWGGSTLPQWRRRGVYRALVAHRARLAEARGLTFVQVDASDDCRPILQRLGLVAVTTTTPYVYTPRP
jgi:hypothetical protein